MTKNFEGKYFLPVSQEEANGVKVVLKEMEKHGEISVKGYKETPNKAGNFLKIECKVKYRQ